MSTIMDKYFNKTKHMLTSVNIDKYSNKTSLLTIIDKYSNKTYVNNHVNNH